MTTKIKTDYGYSVECYGDINEESTIFMSFDRELYDGQTESAFNTWAEAVKELAAYAQQHNSKLIQLESD